MTVTNDQHDLDTVTSTSADKEVQQLENVEYDKGNEEENVDDEGLRVDGYDVILCGTGLVQSILASALSRAGKRILHCDGNDIYGELHSVVSLSNWMDHLKDPSVEEDKSKWSLQSEGALASLQIHSYGLSPGEQTLKEGISVSTSYGDGFITSISKKERSVAVQLRNWKLANASHVTVYYGMKSSPCSDEEYPEYVTKLLASREDVIATNTLHRRNLMDKKRFFYLDLTPGLLFASGNAVQGLVKSSVSEYCEFKNMLGLYIYGDIPEKRNSSKSEIKNHILSRVPCSKGDVFATKLMTPAEKRRLMKVLQLASDFAIAGMTVDDSSSAQNSNDETNNINQDEKKESISSINERQLRQGRSLSRPQNKTISTTALGTLQQYVEENKVTFDQYLIDEHKLPERLRHIVLYALALCSSPTVSVRDGMHNLCMHLNSLGKYGKTALLVPLYGAGELSQAFCRSAAVHGATYLLRRPAKKILVSDQLSSSTSAARRIEGISLSPSLFGDNSCNQNEKSILAPHVVVPKVALPRKTTNNLSSKCPKHRVLRRISVLSGKLMLGEDNPTKEQRHVIIIPPNSKSSINNSHVIYGVALDDSVSIAPSGATVLHLSTIVDVDGVNNEKIEVDDSPLRHTVKELIDSCQMNHNGIEDNDFELLEEIYHISFSYEMTDVTVESNSLMNEDIPNGLHFCGSPMSAITEFDTAFVHAKQIFEKIVGNDIDFLSLSSEMEQVINKNQAGRMARDEDDDDGRMLESAMSMLQTNISPAESDMKQNGDMTS